MKNALTVLIASLAFAGAAQATELDYPPVNESVSTVTRAEVRQELADAKAMGQISNREETTFVAEHATASREQVRAELIRARAEGVVTYGEQAYPPVHG